MDAWGHLVQHREEIGWAALFGLLFALAFELLNPASHIRAKIRQWNNRWSEHSNYLIARRIEELEKYKKQLADVRWQYLFALQMVFLTLFSLCVGSASWVMAETALFRIHPSVVEAMQRFSSCCFGAGGGLALIGFTHTWRDTHEKVQAVVHKVGLEIEGLQKVLKARSTSSTE